MGALDFAILPPGTERFSLTAGERFPHQTVDLVQFVTGNCAKEFAFYPL
jgi:hypothetical protein